MSNSKKMYNLAIYDDDVGGIIYEYDSLLYSELLQKLKDMILFYSPDDEVIIDDEKFQEDMKEWDSRSILKTIEEVDFFGGLVELNIWYPGRHRQIQIKLKKQKEN